jgi:hypothetical protein
MHPAYLSVFLWSLFIFLSFWGYGEILRRTINRPEFDDIGWGLTAAWGMSVVLAIGGLLMAFHLAKAATLMFLVLIGAAAALYYMVQHLSGSRNPKSYPPVPFYIIILFFLALLAFASSIAWPLQIDPNDDVVLYLFYPQKILQTGTLLDPFSFRRMTTYGGQHLLQALVMIVGGEKNGHVPDRGFGMLMLFGMLLHLSKGISKQLGLLRFLTIGCLFFVSVPRINTGSHLTGAAMILALILTISKLPAPAWANWKCYIAPSLLLAGAGAFRPTYLLCCAGIVTLEPIIRHWTALKSSENDKGCSAIIGKHDRQNALAYFVPSAFFSNLKSSFACVLPVALLSFIILIPWMVVLWQSNGTPIYPLFKGTINPEFAVLGNKGGRVFDMASALAFLLTPEILVLLFCLGLTGFTNNRPLAYAAVAMSVALTWLAPYLIGVAALNECYRLTFPMLMPVALWVILSTLARCKDGNGSWDTMYIFPIVLVLGLLLALNLSNAGRELVVQAEYLPQQIISRDPLVNTEITRADRELQNLTPPGSKILIAADTPYGFDFVRNEIVTVDVPGGCSPSGKWPLFQGSKALEKYLVDQGFKYIIASDFDNAMLFYTRKFHKENRHSEWFIKEVHDKYFLDFMDAVDGIAKNGQVVATAANLRLIELNSRIAPSAKY